MKPRTPGLWLIAAIIGLLSQMPTSAIAGMTPAEVKAFEGHKEKALKGDLKAHFDVAACYARGWGVARDQAEAVKWVRKAADQGYPMAQFSLANCYDNGNGVTKDPVEAAKWMRKAADQGFVSAQNSLAAYYANGKGVAISQVEAAKWFRKAADQGDAAAQYNLGSSYHLGRGVAKDAVEAVKWYRKAAEQGDPPSQFNLGNYYLNGEGVAKDAAEAAKWYRKAADQGHPEAAQSLDALSRKTPSKGTPPAEKTVTTLDGARVVITKKGNVTNVETVGNLSPNKAFTGSTLAAIKPENNPVDLLNRAVELFPQNQRAAYQLGLAARLQSQFDQKRVADRSAHQAFGVLTMQPANERVLSWGGGSQTIGAEDHRAVLEWARKSGPPTYHPAWMMQHGMGAFGATGRAGGGISAGFVAATAWSEVLNDYAKFIDTPSFWVTRQERNNPANFPTLLKAMESSCLSELDSGRAGDVGRQKLRAVVVGFNFKAADPTLALLDARDAMRAIVATANSTPPTNSTPPASEEVKAFESYKAKAEQGDVGAQNSLGLCYYFGRGVAKDYDQAVNLWRKGADQGDAYAQHLLAHRYATGEGVARDPVQAVNLWYKSAEQGNARAQFELGTCYCFGRGLAKDEIEAYAYWSIAGITYAPARESLAILEKKMSANQIAAGQKRSKELQKEIDAKSAAKKAGK
jgi:TPR repeat protein